MARNIFQRTLDRLISNSLKRSIENPNVPVFEALHEVFESATGVEIFKDNVFTLTAFWNGVVQIGDSLASYPKGVVRKQGNIIEQVDHDANSLLKYPNEGMKQFDFFHAMMVNTLTWGNGLAYIEYKNKRLRTEPQLRLVNPGGKTEVKVSGTRKYYNLELYNGEKLKDVPARDVIHVPGLSYDGLWGRDIVSCFKDALGLAKSQELYNSDFYKNGTALQGYIKVPGKLADGADDTISKKWQEKYGSMGTKGKTAVLGSGTEYVPLGTTPEAAQFLESRKFSIEEISRILNIPPHKLKHLEHGTLDNIESQESSYHTTTMQPWVIRFEEELTSKLLTENEKQNGIYIDFNMNSILRADIKAKAQYYDTGIKGQWLTPNDVRQLEGYNPVSWGDVPVDFQKSQIDDNQNKPAQRNTKAVSKTKK